FSVTWMCALPGSQPFPYTTLFRSKPLFQLSIGNPGSSFAVEIARNIGLPESVISDASTIVGSDYINMDKYLQDISRDKRYWERKDRKSTRLNSRHVKIT